MAELDEIMEQVSLANRMLYEMNLADSTTIERGHVSYRLPNEPDKFVIKGLGRIQSRRT
jgi:ribulose-5-phosphate 4-epimerase/fuculose-1-phosphate aldolase